VDRDGFLVTLGGLRVQGYPADAAGRVSTAVGDLQVGDASTLPHATGSVRVGANLQADAVVPPAWDPADPTGTSTFCTTVTLYDSLGKAHDTSVYFRNQGGGQWEWHALSDGGALVGGTAGAATEIAAGTLTFDAQGRLQDVTQATNFNPLGAVSPQPFTLNFGDPTAAGGTGLAGITQFASASATTFVGQDGYPSGELSSIQIDRRGVVVGTFSNGQTRPLGQVGVARVAAPEMLERSGENLYTVTSSSGYAVVGAAGDGGRGFISSGTLEQSNVEISEQFVRMIAAQRSFEANAKTITTADQLLSELISMKR
jgi:flagellar hook protein FlgE